MFTVHHPADMNETFARAFNSRELNHLLDLYEESAVLCTDSGTEPHRGRAQIAEALTSLLALPGRMQSRNHFCIQHGELALLRADYALLAPDERTVLLQGATAEVVRQQADGSWRYVIDHANALSAPSVLRLPAG